MSTDRELLELAAKAIGYKVVLNRVEACQIWTDADESEFIRFWNPINKDGDALRLAVKLNMIPSFGVDFVSIGSTTEHNNADKYAAARRCIVRAAAKIGKDM